MIDLVLLIARLLFVALLYLFLFAIMRTGIGMVKGSRKKERAWTVAPRSCAACPSRCTAP